MQQQTRSSIRDGIPRATLTFELACGVSADTVEFNTWMMTVECKRLFLFGLLAAIFCYGGYTRAADVSFGDLAKPSAALDKNTPIEVDAEQLDYDKVSGRITASGNVIITCGLDELHADRVLVNMNTGDAYALGNVVLKRGDNETKGTKLQYNFRTRVCSLDDPEVNAEPFRVLAEKVTRAGQNEYVLHDAKVTTCVFKHPHSHSMSGPNASPLCRAST